MVGLERDHSSGQADAVGRQRRVIPDIRADIHYGHPAAELVEILADLGIYYPDCVFLDLGAGKGRALLLASQFPFKRIVGVEFSIQSGRRSSPQCPLIPRHPAAMS